MDKGSKQDPFNMLGNLDHDNIFVCHFAMYTLFISDKAETG